MSELNNREDILNEDNLEKAVGGSGAMKLYCFKCINPDCSQFGHKVKVMLPRPDVKVPCKLCKHLMELQV